MQEFFYNMLRTAVYQFIQNRVVLVVSGDIDEMELVRQCLVKRSYLLLGK